MNTCSRIKRIARIFVWLLAGVLLLATLGAIYQAFATKVDQQNYSARGQLVDIGGYRLYIFCVGENLGSSPTVILEQGLGGISDAWVRVQSEIAQTTRVCAYDRAGMGRSDLSPEPRDAEHIATELHSLLHNAGVAGPYVLVGWSFGGLYVRAYAGQYPDDVIGMVLLDSSHSDQWSSTAAGEAQYKSNARVYTIAPWLARMGVMRVMGLFQPHSGLPHPQSEALKASFAATKDWDAQNAEFPASASTNDQVRRLGSLGNMLLFVLTATEHGTPPEQEQLWQNWQKQLALLSTNSEHQIVTGVDHASFWLDPEIAKISVQAVLQVVEAARTGEQLRSQIVAKSTYIRR